MIIAVAVTLLCAVALAAGANAIARRASPRAGAIALVVAAITTALTADGAVAILVGARLLDAAPLATALGWRPERPGHIPVPVPISIAAAIVLSLLVPVGWRDWRRARRATHPLRVIGQHAAPEELIVVTSTKPLAQALAGRRGHRAHIVVSDGMLRALDPAERRVLLAHERSHLRHRHHHYRSLIRLASRTNPLLRATIGATDLLLERWADDDAACEVGDRRLTAQAVAHAALAKPERRLQHAPAGLATHALLTRIHGLLAAAPARGARLAPILPAALTVTAALGAAAAMHELAHLFDMLRGDG